MPALQIFGRPWNIASDDFVFPCITEAVVRIAWVLIALAFALLQNPWSCVTYKWISLVATMFAVHVVSTALAIAMAQLSSRGSIMETAKRKHVITLLYLRIPIFVCEFVWTIASTLILFDFFNGDGETCSFVLIGLRLTIILEWIIIATVLIGSLLIFNPAGRTVDCSFMAEQSWRRRLYLLKIMRASEVRHAVNDIACLFASFFTNTDFVFSDIVAGLLLHIHSPNRRVCDNECDETTAAALVEENPEWMEIPRCYTEILRFLEFSIASYTVPNYLVSGCCAWFHLCRGVCGCGCYPTHRKGALIIGDDCCACGANSLFLSVDDDVEVYFASFRNAVFTTPFFVLADHQTKSIVIAIRGSASLIDLVTDLSLHEDALDSVDVSAEEPTMLEPVPSTVVGDSSESHKRVHRGMLNGARNILAMLRQHRVLEELQARHPNYQIVVCGHSLGGGVGSLLTLLLRHSYPNIRCYAFSPPGCVISENGIAETEPLILSVVLGDDLIPRISYQSILRLKSDIELELFSTDRAKYEILIKGIFKLFFPSPWELHPTDIISDESSALHMIESSEQQSEPSSSASVHEEAHQSPRHRSQIASSSRHQQREEQQRIHLRPPGRILHFTAKNREIGARWINHEDLFEIKPSASMVTDHLPHILRRVIKKACADSN